MDLFEKTKELCRLYDIKPARSRGQNFLIDEEVYDKIVELAVLNADDIVLEVGPGLGFLTERLARKTKKVVAVELDDKLAVVLDKRLKEQGINNVEILNEDILKIKMTHPNPSAGGECLKYKAVANLPYNVTSIFLRKFLTTENRPQSMTLMLQKEVAERIAAQPGEMSLLAVSVQYYADVRILDYVSRDKFWPAPEVDSAVIKLDMRKRPPLDNVDKEKEFFRLVRIGFSSRRKMLKNNLMAGYKINQEMAKNKIKSVSLDEKVRAQDLSLSDWQKLFVQFG